MYLDGCQNIYLNLEYPGNNIRSQILSRYQDTEDKSYSQKSQTWNGWKIKHILV